MSLPYNLLHANALPLLISHHILPYLLSYPAWQISSDLLSAECIPGAKCDWLDLHRLKLVVWWSEWHLMWFVLPHAVSQFFWFSATLPLHHPELCYPKGLQAPKTSYDPRTGRDMLNFAFGTQAHCPKASSSFIHLFHLGELISVMFAVFQVICTGEPGSMGCCLVISMSMSQHWGLLKVADTTTLAGSSMPHYGLHLVHCFQK